MQIISCDNVVVQKRQRSVIASVGLNELIESILTSGLLHPPVVFPMKDGKFLLVAGERRYRAIHKIHESNKIFSCDGKPIAPGEIPVTFTDLETEVDRSKAEYAENTAREDLDWKDQTRALAGLHNMRLEENPEHTKTNTAKEVAEAGKQSVVGTSKSVSHLRGLVRESLIINEHLNDPAIQKARNASEAYTLILKKEEEKLNSLVAKRRIAAMPEKPDLEIRHGSLLDMLPQLDGEQFDLEIADPPYGIEAGGGGFRSRTVHHHNYQDDIDHAKEIAKAIIVEGFRICKPRANLFMFCDIDLFPWLKTICGQVGWTPFRRPLIWGKSDSEGLAPWGSNGPRITTEFILYATKGQRGLISSPIDYLRVNRVPRNERIYAAEKPVELLRTLIECSTLPGDRVIDPCCGSGSTIVACRETRRTGLGIEKDESAYNTAMSNLHRERGEVNEPSVPVSKEASNS